MVKKVMYRLFRVNTYGAGYMLFEVDDSYDENVQELRNNLMLDSLGYKLNLLAKLAELTVIGYVIISVTEFNVDGSKPKVSYATNKDFKKIVKYLQNQKTH